MEVPTYQIDNRFTIELICDENFEEALQQFNEGHLLNPFMKAVKTTKEQVFEFYTYKFKIGVESRPLQQYCVRDKQADNKIIATLLTQHFAHTKDKQIEFKEGLKKIITGKKPLETRFNYDMQLECSQICKQYLDDIEETQNPLLYQQASVSVLPQYHKCGLFMHMMYLSVHSSLKLGTKAYVDVIHNHGTGHVAKKYFGGKIINEIDVRDHLYEGEKVFDNDENVVQLAYSPLDSQFGKKVSAESEKYDPFFYDSVKYLEFQAAQRLLKDTHIEETPELEQEVGLN